MRKALGERIGRHAYDGNVRFVRALAARRGEKPPIMAFYTENGSFSTWP